MRLVTWCEPEWKGDRWKVRQITEHFPNLFQRLVLRQVANTKTRTFELRTSRKADVDFKTWTEVRYTEDSVKRLPVDDDDDRGLTMELVNRVKCVLRTGTIEDIMAGKTPEQIETEQNAAKSFDAAVGNQLASALAIPAATASLGKFQEKLREIKDDKLKLSRAMAELEQQQAELEAKQSPPRPRTMAEFLAMAGVTTAPPPEYYQSQIMADVLAEAEKINMYRSTGLYNNGANQYG